MANPFTPGQKAELDAEVARLEAQLALLNKAVGTTGASTEAAPAPAPAPVPVPVPASPSAAKLPVYGRAPRPEPAPEPEMTYAPTQKGLRADPGYSPELKKYYGAMLVPSADAARIQANANTFEQFRKEGAESVNEEFAKFDADLKQSEARLRDLQRQAAKYARKPTPGVAAEDIPAQLPPELAAQLKSAETEYSTLRTKRNAARILQQGVAAKAEYETYAPRAIEKTQAALEKTQDPRLSALLDYQYTMQAKALDIAKQEADALARNLKIPLKDMPISLGFDQRGRVILDTAQIEETLYYKYRDAAAQDLGFKTWDSIKDFKGMKEGKTSLALQKEADRLATQKAKAEILRAYQGSRNISLYDPDPEGTTASLADAPLVVRELMAVLTPKPARTLTPKAAEIMPERSGEYFWRTVSGLGAMIAARADAYAKSDLPTRNANVETVGDAVSYVADTTGLFVLGRLPNTEQERAFIAKIRENPITAAILADEMGRAYDIATDYKGDPTTKAVLQFTAGAVGFIGLDAQAPDPLTLGLLGLGGAVKAIYSVPNQMNKLAKATKAASELEDFGTAIRLVEEQSPAGAAILEQKVAVESVINPEVRGEINKLQRKVETAQEALEKIVARARGKGIDVGSGSIADAGLAREYQVAQREVAVAQLEAASAKRMALEQAVTDFDQTKKPLVRLLNAQVKRYKKAESELAAVLKEIEDFENANSTVIGFYDKLAEAENAARQKAGTAYDAYAQAKRTKSEAVVEAGKELQAAKDALAAATTEADRVAAAKRIKDAEKAVRELGKRTHPLTSAVTTAKAEADLALEEAKTAGSARAKYQSEHIDKFAAQNKMETRARLARERMGAAEGILRTNGVDPTAPVIVDEAVRAKLAEDLKIVTGAERGLKQTLADSEKIIGNIERVIGAAASVENAAERSVRWRKTFARFAEEVQQGGQRYGTVAKRMGAQSPKFVDVLATTGPNAVARTASAAEEAAGIERVLARGGREYLTTLAAKMSDDPEKVVDLLLRRGDALAAVAQKIAKAEGRVPLTVEEVKVLQQELEDGLRTAAATAEDDPFQVVKAIRLAERLDPNMRPSVLVTRTGLTPALRLDNLLPAIGGTVRYYAQGLDPIIAASGVGMSKTLENIIRTGRNISAQIDDELMSIIRQANFDNLDPEVARRVADALNYSLAGRALGDEVAWTNLLQKIRNKVALSDDERRVVQVAALVQYIDTTTPLAYTGGKTFVNAISGDETMWQIARRQLLNDPRIRGFLGYEAPVRTGSAPGSAGPTFLTRGRKPQGPITFSRRGGGPFRRKLPSDSPEIRDPGGHPPADLNDIPPLPPGLVGRTPEPPKVAAPTPAASPKLSADEFRAWFGDSKIIDSEGKPLVVYHGTPGPGFASFDPQRIGSQNMPGWFGSGFYFTDNRGYAEGIYGVSKEPKAPMPGFEASGNGGTVAPVYLKLERPFIFEADDGNINVLDAGIRLPEEIHDAVLTRAGFDPDVSKGLRPLEGGKPDNAQVRIANALREELQDRGYDGVIAVQAAVGPNTDEIVVFHPNQIKFASEVADTSKPDILEVRRAVDIPGEAAARGRTRVGTFRPSFDAWKVEPPPAPTPVRGPSAKGKEKFKGLYEAVSAGKLRITETALDDVVRITDARAKAWAAWTGKAPDDWYDLVFQGPMVASPKNERRDWTDFFDSAQAWALYVEAQPFDTKNITLWMREGQTVQTLIHEIGHFMRYDAAYGPGGVPSLEMADELDRVFKGTLSDGTGYFRRLFEAQTEARKLGPQAEYDLRRSFTRRLSPDDAKTAELAEEFFANAFSNYIREGVAPTPGLKGAFQRMITWLYEVVTAGVGWLSPIELVDDQRKFFARMLDAKGTSTKIAKKAPARPPGFPVVEEGNYVFARYGVEPLKDPATGNYRNMPLKVLRASPELDMYEVVPVPWEGEAPFTVFGSELSYDTLGPRVEKLQKRVQSAAEQLPLEKPSHFYSQMYQDRFRGKDGTVKAFYTRAEMPLKLSNMTEEQAVEEMIQRLAREQRKYEAYGYRPFFLLEPTLDDSIGVRMLIENTPEAQELNLNLIAAEEARKAEREAWLAGQKAKKEPATSPKPEPEPEPTAVEPEPVREPEPAPEPEPVQPEPVREPEPEPVREPEPTPEPEPMAEEPPPPVEPPTGGEPPAGGAPPPRGPRPQAPSPLAPKEVPPTPSPIPAHLEGSVVPEGFVALVRSWLPPSYRANLSESQVRSLERQAYKLLEQNLQEGGTFLDYMTKLQNLTRITFGSADPRITRTYGFAARAVGHARMLQAAADATKAALAPFNGQEIADVMRLFSGKYREISDYNGVLRTLNTLGQPVTVTSSASPKGGVGLGKLSLQLLRLSQEPAGEEVWTTNILLSQLEDNIPKIIKELDAQPNPGRPLLGTIAEGAKKTALSWWKTSVVTGLLVPNPRYYLNNIAGDFSQMWFEMGFIPAARQSFQNLPVNIPLLGRLMQNTMSDLTAKAAGKPVLGTVTNALFNPYLHRVWNGTRGTIRTAQGAVFTLDDARKWMVEDGILDVFLHEELPMAFSRLVPSTWDRTLGGWQREMEQFANFVQQRQRSGLYLELLKNGYTRAEAKRMTLNALYDWKNALAEGEVMGLISSITFYRFWKLAMEQFGRAIMEPLVRPSSNLLTDALRGRTRLARGRQQVQLLDQVLSPAIQSMQTQEEYQDMDTKMGDLARLIYPSWMRDRSLAFSHALSPEYARQLATTRGYYVSDAAITMPRFTVLDTAAMTSAMFMPLVTVAGKAAGFETTPDWKEQMFTPFLEQLDPLTREGIDAIMDTYNPMSTGGKTARVTPGEALVLDRMHSLFSTPRVEGEFVDRDPRTGTLEANPLELTAMRLTPFFGTQLTRLFDNAYGENPASIIAYNRNMKIAQLRSAAQLESDPEKAASYAKEAAALDAQQGETIADAAGWMMLRTLGVGPYAYTVNDQVARVTKGVAAELDPKTSKFKEPEFGGYIFEEEPVEAEDVMETVAP